MCGIIGYIGKNNTIDVLLNGLYALEYRGYDSSGIAINVDNKISLIRSVGRVSKLEEKIKSLNIKDGVYGIAHTRWATNGETNINNAHPHKVGRVTIVHNGIIENANILKEKLVKEGYHFNSDTDSEVVAALLDYKLRDDNILDSIELLKKELVGSYALGIIIDESDELYALRKDSPLLIGIGDSGNFIASDITAIIKYTSDYILLDSGDIAVLKANSYEIYNGNKKINKEVLKSTSSNIDNDKNGYNHHMLKEIMDEPQVISNLLDRYNNSRNWEEVDLSKYKSIDIVACGSAMYAGLVGQVLLEEYANIKTSVYAASEYRYKKKIYNDKTLVILISQSGETADTIAAMREVKKLGIDTLAIVNNSNSTIAREVDRKILTEAGVEVAVATTKAYILQVCVLSLISYVTSYKKGLLKDGVSYSDFYKLPSLIDLVIKNTDKYREVVSMLSKSESCFFIGRGIDYAICMEGSLKLKEISYIHSEAYQAGELKHGTISLIEKGIPVIAIITDKTLKEKTLSNLREVEARGAESIVITTEELEDNDKHLKIVIKSANRFLDSMLAVCVLQLLAYYVALDRGCDIDKPRNLAKSVTVE